MALFIKRVAVNTCVDESISTWRKESAGLTTVTGWSWAQCLWELGSSGFVLDPKSKGACLEGRTEGRP